MQLHAQSKENNYKWGRYMLHALKQCLNTVQVICRICAFESLYAYIYIWYPCVCVYLQGRQSERGNEEKEKKRIGAIVLGRAASGNARQDEHGTSGVYSSDITLIISCACIYRGLPTQHAQLLGGETPARHTSTPVWSRLLACLSE